MSTRDRETFDAAELAVVTSNYDLGVIESITDFPRGSRRSPKVGIVCERGKFLLKRRALVRSNPDRARFAHRVQIHLALAGFPIARLIPTRDHTETIVQIRERVYELFEFIVGQPFSRKPSETRGAGEVLARFHQVMEDFVSPPSIPTPLGDYHDAPGVRSGLATISATLSSHDSFSGDEAELTELTRSLLDAYDRAAEAVNDAGFSLWPQRIVHADWHPGNMLFKKERVIAVVDYDAVRRSRRAIDVANGVMQFSMIARGDPATWPAELDEERFHAFFSGYESLSPLTAQERGCIPDLMVEALIAECVAPIAQTGAVGRWAGYRMLQMIRRKLAWLDSEGERLMKSVRR